MENLVDPANPVNEGGATSFEIAPLYSAHDLTEGPFYLAIVKSS